jgi:photosystem II stability/assembly factor-like uncharacterized protein
MLKPFSFHRLAILSIALAAPALLQAGANTWTNSRPGGASILHPYLVASSAGHPDLVYSAEGPDFFRSTDGGLTWNRVASFDQIDSLYVDPASGAVFVGALGPGSLAGIYKSADGGTTWHRTVSESTEALVRLFAGSSGTSSALYASTDRVIFKSVDGGETWDQGNRPAGGAGRLSQQIGALVVNPADGVPYAGGYDYDAGYYAFIPVGPFLRKSTDQGDTWTDLERRGLDGIDVSAIAFDPVNPSTIYAGAGTTPDHYRPTNSLWRSADGGANWTLAQSGLPSHASISGLVVDPGDPNTVYAATDSGVYRTRNSGANWFRLGQQVLLSGVGSLTLAPSAGASDRVLRVGGTYGVFQLEIGTGALDIAAGVGRSHVLSWDADSLTVHTLDDSGHESATPPEGPSSSWLATAISDGPDGLSRVLWVNGDGRAALEIVGPVGSVAVFPFAGSPADVSVGADGAANLLSRNQSDAMSLSRIDASGNVTLETAYGPYQGWTAVALADTPDGSTWVLWHATDGRTSVSIHRDRGVMVKVLRFPASPGLAAADITVASDGRPRLLRVGTDGKAEVSTIDASGNLSDAQTHNPGWRPRRIAAGPDGFTRLLFSDGSGAAKIWRLKPDNSHIEDGSESEPPDPEPPDPGSPEPQPPGSIVGDWIGTFSSVDFIDCDSSPSPASATFSRQGSVIDGILHMTRQGCGAESVLFHGTMVAGRVRGTLERGGGPSHYVFDAGSTAEGVLDGTRLELTLHDNSPFPYPIPGGTMTLHR